MPPPLVVMILLPLNENAAQRPNAPAERRDPVRVERIQQKAALERAHFRRREKNPLHRAPATGLPMRDAGTPTTVAQSGTSRVTTAPAPTTARDPIDTPGSTTAPIPMSEPAPTDTSPPRCTPGATCTKSPIRAW